MHGLLDSKAVWRRRPITLGRIPIFVLTAGNDQNMPGKTAAERHAAWLTWKALHDELIAASTSRFRQHVVVPGAEHSERKD